MNKINPEAKWLYAVKLIAGAAVGIGAGTLATAAIGRVAPGEMKRITKIGVYVASVSLSYAAGDAAGAIVHKQIDECVDIVNSGIDAVNTIKLKNANQ